VDVMSSKVSLIEGFMFKDIVIATDFEPDVPLSLSIAKVIPWKSTWPIDDTTESVLEPALEPVLVSVLDWDEDGLMFRGPIFDCSMPESRRRAW
jgi:hypothetical protein